METETKNVEQTPATKDLKDKAEAVKEGREVLKKKEEKVNKRKRALAENGKTLKQTLFEDVLPPHSDKRGMNKGAMQETLVKEGYHTTKSNPKVIIGQALWALLKEEKVEKVKHGYWRLTAEATKERSKLRKRLRDKRRRERMKAQKAAQKAVEDERMEKNLEWNEEAAKNGRMEKL